MGSSNAKVILVDLESVSNNIPWTINNGLIVRAREDDWAWPTLVTYS